MRTTSQQAELLNAEYKYVKKALARFLKVFREKGQSCHPRIGSYTRTTCRSTPKLQSSCSCRQKGVQTIRHPLYSPDLAPADFFLFPRVKAELAGLLLTQKSGGGRCPEHPQDNFTTAFRQWMERCDLLCATALPPSQATEKGVTGRFASPFRSQTVEKFLKRI
jgi:hypothetical protein